MKLLLDTHIWLWSLLEPARLTRKVAEALEASSNEKWLSPMSVWEVLLLAGRRRVVLEPDAPTWVRTELKRLGFTEAPVNHEVAIDSRSIDLAHPDPVDRFLLATARVYDLTFVTADDRLRRFKAASILSNS